MKITVDRDHGITSLDFESDTEIVKTTTFHSGIIVDFDKDENVVGIEIINEIIKNKKEVILRVE